MTLERGTLINQRYRIVEVLGQGGMGSVYRAVDENLGVEVALKENLFTTEEYSRQFHREAVILANLRHPNLTRVTDHFVIDGQGQYLVMDFIEGEDLRQRLDRLGVIEEEEVVAIGVAVCDALGYLDSRTQPIVHRDIKPGNVKLTPGGNIFLVDFGLAKVIQIGQATTTGARAMTPGYSPPEQYGTAHTDHRSDLYSLGATLYAALTASIPEDGLARMMGQSDLTPIRKRNPKISPELAAVIERALEVRPEDRYQSAYEFKQALLNSLYQKAPTGKFIIEKEESNVGSATESPSKKRKRVIQEQVNHASEPIINETVDERKKFPLQFDDLRNWRYFWPAMGTGGILVIVVLLILWRSSVSPAAVAADFTKTPTGNLTTIASGFNPTASVTIKSPNTPISPTPTSRTSVSSTTRTPASTDKNFFSPTLTLTPTPVGGGQGQIAFASNESGTVQIWMMNLDGTDLTQITDMPEGACQPDWSPDGMRLAFISPCKGNRETYPGAGLFIINLDGSNLTPLPNFPGGDYDPAWSPDGKVIAFSSLRIAGRPRLYSIALDDLSITRLSAELSTDFNPAWSPDGKQIAYISRKEGPSDVWVMDRDGGNQKRYTKSGKLINSYPVWSKDMSVILFTQIDKPGGVPQLAAASKVEGVLTEYLFKLGPNAVREAKFSPDGLWLVFESWSGFEYHDIYISSSSGAGRTQVTTLPGLEFDPVWRPLVFQP